MSARLHITKEILEEANFPTDTQTVLKYDHLLWHSFRTDRISMRLSKPGLDFLIDKAGRRDFLIRFFDPIEVHPMTLIWFDRNIKTPFYIGRCDITVFDPRLATQLHLFSGDINRFCLSKVLSKRDNSTEVVSAYSRPNQPRA